MKKLIAMITLITVLAATLSAGTGLAWDEPEYTLPPEILDRLKSPDYLGQEFEPGILIVDLKTRVDRYSDYEELFPELSTDYILPMSRFYRGRSNSFYYQRIKLVLKIKTREATLAAIDLLWENASVEAVRIVEVHPVTWAADPDNVKLYGDLNLDGKISNADLITLARGLVGLEEMTDYMTASADLDGDGAVSNADLISLARLVVNGVPDRRAGIETLTEEVERGVLDAYSKAFARNQGGVYSMDYLGGLGEGTHAFVITGSGVYPAVIVELDVAGYHFTFGSPGTHIFVYRDGELWRFEKAYELGIISAEDVGIIHGRY